MYDIVYEKLMIETYINIEGILILIILFCDDIRFVLDLVAKNKLCSTKYLFIWQERGVESYTLSVKILTYGSLRVRNFWYLFSYS